MKDLSNENIVHIKRGDIEYIQFRKLLEYKNVVHAFTLKELDFAGFDTYEQRRDRVEEGYTKICNEFNIDKNNICRPRQTHTNRVEKVGDGDEGIYNIKFDNVDGLVTDKKDKALILGFADCTPLLFYDPIKKVIANTHSGWKGTYKEIGIKTIEKMEQEYGCNVKDIICCIGPHIRQCHFEVDKNVMDMFYSKFRYMKEIDNIIVKQNNKEKYNIDTCIINKNLLLEKGLSEKNIIDSKICTVCNSNICHSFRIEKELSGRSISIMELI